jgi:hypothetical protein
MTVIFLIILKIIGDALCAILFYNLGRLFLEKFFLLNSNKETPNWLRYLISSVTEILIFLCLLLVIILFNRYFK